MLLIEVNKRIKELRVNIIRDANGKKYSGRDFADKLGFSRDVISNIEYDRVEVKESVINLICLTFNVNKDWIVNGIEPIFKERANNLMGVNKRIKELRVNIIKDVNGKKYSGRDFADKLGVSHGVINNMETSKVEAKDNVIRLICLTFDVNEKWIRTGTGAIFKDDKANVMDLLADTYNLTEFSKKAIDIYVNLPIEKQKAFENLILTFSSGLLLPDEK